MSPRIAAVVTEYRPNAHADVIVGKFLRGFPCDDGLHPPRVEVASLYIDQVNDNDTGLATAERSGVPVYPSIRRALTLGGDHLAVDGVLLIGEHGDYPRNEKGQQLYPRRHFFEQVAGVMASSGRSVPVFSDKHLSYNWADALWMVERAEELGVPLMAGSSLPVCWRRPWLEHPLGASLEAAVAIGYGPLESYGFHALETLQCMVERRADGESGVAAVQSLTGEAVWRWLQAEPEMGALAERAAGMLSTAVAPWERAAEHVPEPAAYLLEYADGLRAAALMLDGLSRSFAYAARTAGRVEACEFVLQGGGPHAHFSYLGRNVEEMFITGRPTYPVERTLLTTGVLAAAMDSRHLGGRRLETPHLLRGYRPGEARYRPTGPAPSGATLDPWPPDEG